uniref:Uncharacterized protein n=1 Tax=Rhizophora mucronata TaxID=61149 RepID=A0A2P2JW41_RHIMU
MIQWYHLRFQSRHSPEAQEVEQTKDAAKSVNKSVSLRHQSLIEKEDK